MVYRVFLPTNWSRASGEERGNACPEVPSDDRRAELCFVILAELPCRAPGRHARSSVRTYLGRNESHPEMVVLLSQHCI